MTDPKLAADEAARKIIGDLQRMDCLGYPLAMAKRTVAELEQDYSAIILAAITRCVCAPSEGMGR